MFRALEIDAALTWPFVYNGKCNFETRPGLMSMTNDDDRFGVPEENLLAAQVWLTKHRSEQRQVFQAYVPTRKEVATISPDVLSKILIGWMCHSPTEIIPSRVQIEEVKMVILRRPDAYALTDLLTKCGHYIHGE